MNKLTIVNQNGQLLVESRQVAEMVGKEHKHLLRDIKGYSEILTQSNFGLSDFFIENTYQDITRRKLPCYYITKKGCDMVANKMTGEKGVLFTATYVTRFEEIEKKLQSPVPMTQLEMIAYSAQALLAQEQAIKQISAAQTKQAEELQGMRDVIALDTTSWRTDTAKLINRIADKSGGTEHIVNIRTEAYKLLNARMGVNVKQRLTNLRNRLMNEGICKSKRDKTNQLDVIGDDKKLSEVFVAIIKEMAIKAGIA